MEKSKCAVIQDDILAVKHALANGIAFEGLACDDLAELLVTLQAQRAEVIASSKAKALASEATAALTASPKTPPKRVAKASKLTSPSRSKVPSTKGKASGSSVKTNKTPKKVGSSSRSPAVKRPAPTGLSREEVKKPRPKTADRLRQLRKSIKVGSVVSVLMDIPMAGRWVRSWVRGEITREMNRSGIFQVAFDHDKYGEGTSVKREPKEGEVDERWIHEQRLEIEHPDFFCGIGKDPPCGLDEIRPRGAWYLHETDSHDSADANGN